MWNSVILGKKGRRRALTATVAVAAFALAAFLVMRAISSGRAEPVRVGWDETVGTMEEVLERYPSREPNNDALRLERLSAAVGVDLATRSARGRDRPSKQRADEFKRVKRFLGSYLQQQLERPDRTIDPPPPELELFLEARSSDLEALRNELLDGGEPRWELQIDKLLAAPIPNLLGQIDLQKLLAADALFRANLGEEDRALADLDASWRLNTALRDDPVLITQLISIAVMRQQLGTLRKLDEVPSYWIDRLSEHDYRESFVTTALLDAWIFTQLDDIRQIEPRASIWRRATWSLARPYVKYCLADVSEEVLWRVQRFGTAGHLCDTDFTAGDLNLDVEIPAWNLVGSWSAPTHLSGAAERVTRLEVDLELTARILEAAAARRANDGAWPDSLAGPERSRCCPGERWAYRLHPDGSLTIELSRELSWGSVSGPRLPTRFTLPPPP